MRTYEVFLKPDGRDEFRHAGSIEAPNDEVALVMARENYARRAEGSRLWLVDRARLVVGAEDFVAPPADKPQRPCLSSRIPYGQAGTPGKLAMIEQAEGVLRDAGFSEVRVRHHEQPGGALAKLELGHAEMERFVGEEMMANVAAQFREAGFTDVTLDTRGYRRGSLNEGVALAKG